MYQPLVTQTSLTVTSLNRKVWPSFPHIRLTKPEPHYERTKHLQFHTNNVYYKEMNNSLNFDHNFYSLVVKQSVGAVKQSCALAKVAKQAVKESVGVAEVAKESVKESVGGL